MKKIIALLNSPIEEDRMIGEYLLELKKGYFRRWYIAEYVISVLLAVAVCMNPYIAPFSMVFFISWLVNLIASWDDSRRTCATIIEYYIRLKSQEIICHTFYRKDSDGYLWDFRFSPIGFWITWYLYWKHNKQENEKNKRTTGFINRRR